MMQKLWRLKMNADVFGRVFALLICSTTFESLKLLRTCVRQNHLRALRHNYEQGLTAPWDPPGAEPFAPVGFKTTGGSPWHFCTSAVLGGIQRGQAPLLAMCPQWAAPRFSEALSNPDYEPGVVTACALENFSA